jgi:16S rRNA (guanine527-N7)-methyltransferase
MLDLLLKGAKELGVELTAAQLKQFSIYKSNLLETNSKFNLTSIITDKGIQIKHFVDSISPLPVFSQYASPKVLDVGSGAGFPGLPLRIACPDIKLTLLESSAKKSGFLREVCSKLDFTDVEVVNTRAEEAGHNTVHREAYDVVLARAVSRLDILSEFTLPFCRLGGVFIALKKGDLSEELAQAEAAIENLGGSLKEVLEIKLSGLKDNRKLVIIEKTSATPLRYPRRPGLPLKRPLK